ncbi:MAG: peroxide stress protein YaaA [Lachnospiraceae bacterium]|nr:peroxide stress protein YaaA [Lachnospiraceae bacterium]
MRIIISPAKKMRIDTDTLPHQQLPVFMDKTTELMHWIQQLSFDEQKTMWACNEKLARENAARFADMNLTKALTPALLSFDGIQYLYMAPAVFEDGALDYVEEHLRILSGFYGVLRPMDGVTPYRLEMQAKAEVNGHKNLYDFWGDSLYKAVIDESRIIINLASKEYSKTIEKYLTPEDRLITCVFGELEGEKVVQKGVYAKMARGEMVRYLASVKAETPEDIKGFAVSGYRFDEARSDEKTFVFVRSEQN